MKDEDNQRCMAERDLIHWDYEERWIPCRECGSLSQQGCACG